MRGEALSVAWSSQQGSPIFIGLPNLILVTDYRLLVKPLGGRALMYIVNQQHFHLNEKTLEDYYTLLVLSVKLLLSP